MSTSSSDPTVLFQSTVDDHTYEVTVKDVNNKAFLTVVEVATGHVVLSESLDFAHEPIFGPDVGDVETWKTAAINAIDTYAANKHQL